MKYLFLILLFTISFNSNSQELTKDKIEKIEALNVNYKNYNLKNIEVQNDLNNILKLDKRRVIIRNIAFGITGLAVASIAAGTYIASTEGKKSGVVGLFASLIIIEGLLVGTISIPFWSSASKKKKERNRLMNKFI